MVQYKIKNTFPLVMRVFGFVFMAFGILLMLGGSLFGIIPIIIGAVFSFIFEGIVFDLEKGRFKEFTGFLNLKFGNWMSLEDYPFISLLNFNVQSAIYSLSNSKSVSRNKVYRLYLLNTSHLDKVLIKEFKTEEKAKAFVNQVEQELSLELVAYSPQISAASRSRRR